MKIAEFMTQGVYTVHSHDTLEKAAGVMWEHDCGAVPVVDDDGRVVSMITDRDVCMAAYTQGQLLAAIPVASAMSQRCVSCNAEETAQAAERAMRQHQIRRLPVVDDMGRLVGIVSINDIVLEATTKPAEMAVTLAAICRHHNRDLSPVST
ncbi:MAG TPA: CBS domain-containing protein [Candidatus Polarisedimenticolaceae bacterium]|nr:CBS domain-containing protein [Candidatus Polarisedimenticolaceae bacterium]